jgi:hypothetical protein
MPALGPDPRGGGRRGPAWTAAPAERRSSLVIGMAFEIRCRRRMSEEAAGAREGLLGHLTSVIWHLPSVLWKS